MLKLTTRCPSCHVAFPVSSAQLQAAKGKVRCGLCQTVFNASEEIVDDDDFLIYDEMPPLAEDIAANDATEQATETDAPATPTDQEDTDRPGIEQEQAFEVPSLPEPPLLRSEPAFSVVTPPERRPRQQPWLLLCAIACLALVAQYLHFHADEIARNPVYLPWMQRLCQYSGCVIDLRDTGRIATGRLVVQNHPTIANALKINVTLQNNAPFQQPFPNLVLLFEDINGKTVASRSLLPGEYLRGKLVDMALMPVAQPVHLELEILDPGKSAQSYTLYLE